jgi:hypothetical protein
MSDWFFWDGENRRGPMDRDELDNRIRFHPNPSGIRVWRSGFSDWRTVDEALKPAPKVVLDPSTLDIERRALDNPQYRNVIARHWRGEYPLWLSYWVINLLNNLFAAAIVVVLAQVITVRGSYSPTRVLAFYAAMWSFIIVISVWQMVGTWRSANKRISERAEIGKRAPWAGLAKITICLGWLQLVGLLLRSAVPQISEAASIAFMDDPEVPAYAIRVMNNGSEAEITGGIKFGLTTDFEKILDASSGIRVVHLDSIGGRIGEGQKLNALIRKRGLDTFVDVKCLSACTLAFAGGRERILKRGAKLGFHRGSFAGEDQVDDHGLGIERTIYTAAGIDSAFVDRALATKNSDMWTPSEAQLLSAGVVTRLSNGDEFAVAGYGGNSFSRNDWDKVLLGAAPVYRVLKDRDPKNYDEILDIFSNGAAKGIPQAELTEEARSKLGVIIRRLLPYADDSVVVDFGRLIVDQYQSLQNQDEAACYKFAAGTGDQTIVAMIPAELTDRELALYAQIVSSARTRPTAEVADSIWDKIRANLVSKGYTLNELRSLEGKTATRSEYARYCDLTISLYREIVKLPSKEAASVLRQMFS